MGLFRRKHEPAEPTADQTADEPVIDLRERTAAPGELVWGMPSRCPECGDFGYLDVVDVERRVMHQHCPTCWARWQITEAEIEAQSAS